MDKIIASVSEIDELASKMILLRDTNPALFGLIKKMADMHVKKSHDYALTGDPFFNFKRTAQIAGLTVNQVFRNFLGVKLARLEALEAEGKEPACESVADTYFDHALYACLWAAFQEETK